jgi:catechol 2,3-dioxygenase-like lactoylglutathione lyase family enzyme
MLDAKKALGSFSVNDIQKARDFYGKTLGLEVSAGPEGTLVLSEAKTIGGNWGQTGHSPFLDSPRTHVVIYHETNPFCTVDLLSVRDICHRN